MSERDPFVKVPVRLVRRLDDEAITIAQLGLAAALRYREWRDGGATTFTLAELKDWLGYDAGTEQLRRDLHALDYGTLTPPQPGRGRWKWSSGGARGGDPGGGYPHPGSTDDADDKAQTSMNGAIAADATSTQAPPAERPLEVEVEVEVEAGPQSSAVDVAPAGRTATADIPEHEKEQDPEAAKGYFADRAKTLLNDMPTR